MRHSRAIACLTLAAWLSIAAAARSDQGSTAQKQALPEAKPPSRASLQLEEMVHDFGSIMAGEPVEHVFEVRNTGTGELVIERVKPG